MGLYGACMVRQRKRRGKVKSTYPIPSGELNLPKGAPQRRRRRRSSGDPSTKPGKGIWEIQFRWKSFSNTVLLFCTQIIHTHTHANKIDGSGMRGVSLVQISVRQDSNKSFHVSIRPWSGEWRKNRAERTISPYRITSHDPRFVPDLSHRPGRVVND